MTTSAALVRRVLIADDEPLVLQTLGSLVIQWGWEVVPVRDGNAALKVLRGDNPPRVAILDWVMPGVDGVEVCRAIRDMHSSDPPYLMMLTGRTSKEDLIAGLEGGADEYLAKPVDPKELRARLTAAWRLVELHANLKRQVQQLEEVPAVTEIVGPNHPGLRQTLRLCVATLSETLELVEEPRYLRSALRTCRGMCLEALGEGDNTSEQQ